MKTILVTTLALLTLRASALSSPYGFELKKSRPKGAENEDYQQGDGKNGVTRSNEIGLGKHPRPDYSQNFRDDFPPPYYDGENAPPPPDHEGTYGQRGKTNTYWNGQYYPYQSYGYGGVIPIIGRLAPTYLAGPFGFYGPYCNKGAEFCTVSKIYINGILTNLTDFGEDFDGTWSSFEFEALVNGTYLIVGYEDGQYTVIQYEGGFLYGTGLFHSYRDDGQNITLHGWYNDTGSTKQTYVINPNTTSNGTVLAESKASISSPPRFWSKFLVLTNIYLVTIF